LSEVFDAEREQFFQTLLASVSADSVGDISEGIREGLHAVATVFYGADAAFTYANRSVTSIQLISHLQKLSAYLLRANGNPRKLLAELQNLKKLLDPTLLNWKDRLAVNVARKVPIATWGYARIDRDARPLLEEELFKVVLEQVICRQITRLEQFFPIYERVSKEVDAIVARIAPGKKSRFLAARRKWINLCTAVNNQRARCHRLQAQFAAQRETMDGNTKLVTDQDIRAAYAELARLQRLCSEAHNQYEMICEDVLTSAEGADVALAHRDTLDELPQEVAVCVHEGFRFFINLTYEAVVVRRRQHQALIKEARAKRAEQQARRLEQHAAEFAGAAASEEAANAPDKKAAAKASKKGKRLRDRLRNLLPM
jgi:hypothetical protein